MVLHRKAEGEAYKGRNFVYGLNGSAKSFIYACYPVRMKVNYFFWGRSAETSPLPDPFLIFPPLSSPNQARKMKWRETSLRLLPQVRCTTSFKQLPLQNVQNGSRPFSLSLELENERLLVLAKKEEEKSSKAIYQLSSSLERNISWF